MTSRNFLPATYPRLLLSALLASTLTACGDGTVGCVEQNFETHLTQAVSKPDGLDVMLHHANQSCAAVGANTFHMYLIESGSAHEHSHTGKWRASLRPVSEMGHDHASTAADADDSHDHASHGHATTSATSGDVSLTAVAGTMPAHGHGTATPPEIDADDASFFEVAFQMPGSWQLDIEFVPHAVTSTVQTVTFTIDVSG